MVNSKIEDQQQQRAIEFQYRQKFRKKNTSCRDEANKEKYREIIGLGIRKDAKDLLVECMEINEF